MIPGDIGKEERRPAGPAHFCYARILTNAWNKAAYEIAAEKAGKMQGIGRAEEKDGKAEMPVLPAARAPESAGKAPWECTQLQQGCKYRYLMRACKKTGRSKGPDLSMPARLLFLLPGNFRIPEHFSDFHQGKAENIGAGPAGSV